MWHARRRWHAVKLAMDYDRGSEAPPDRDTGTPAQPDRDANQSHWLRKDELKRCLNTLKELSIAGQGDAILCVCQGRWVVVLSPMERAHSQLRKPEAATGELEIEGGAVRCDRRVSTSANEVPVDERE